MGHSMGAAVSNYFTALFPEMVLALINVDFMRPFTLDERVVRMRDYGLILSKAERLKGKAPVYSESDAIERLVNARVMGDENEMNVDHECAAILLPRSAKREEDGYSWRHDPRARPNFLVLFGGRNYTEAVGAVRCPVLSLCATRGVVVLPESFYAPVVKAYESNAKWFKRVTIEGTHHVHLTHPERVAPHINKFYAKLPSLMNRRLLAKY